MNDNPSCLLKKLGHYVELRNKDRDQLAAMEKSERNFAAGAEVYQGGDENRNLYVVKHGWAYSYTDLPDGRRQIIKLHVPGDIIGFPDIALKHMTTSLRTVEDVVLCPFPKSALDTVFRESPRVSALLLSIALRDQVVFIDLLRAMGRMSARERITYMLLDLLARLRITNKQMTDTLRLPLNQSQIADYLGLTNVYVSRTLVGMERNGVLSRRGNMLRLLQVNTLSEDVDFHDRYMDMDTSWFPA